MYDNWEYILVLASSQYYRFLRQGYTLDLVCSLIFGLQAKQDEKIQYEGFGMGSLITLWFHLYGNLQHGLKGRR